MQNGAAYFLILAALPALYMSAEATRWGWNDLIVFPGIVGVFLLGLAFILVWPAV